jgi:hypothetical protein
MMSKKDGTWPIKVQEREIGEIYTPRDRFTI